MPNVTYVIIILVGRFSENGQGFMEGHQVTQLGPTITRGVER